MIYIGAFMNNEKFQLIVAKTTFAILLFEECGKRGIPIFDTGRVTDRIDGNNCLNFPSVAYFKNAPQLDRIQSPAICIDIDEDGYSPGVMDSVRQGCERPIRGDNVIALPNTDPDQCPINARCSAAAPLTVATA
jgi:hypothetical protein